MAFFTVPCSPTAVEQISIEDGLNRPYLQKFELSNLPEGPWYKAALPIMWSHSLDISQLWNHDEVLM